MAKLTQTPGNESARLAIALAALDGTRTRVGWFESNKYPDGTPVAYVAAIQEHGAPAQKIPPRPFFRPTIAAEEANWRKLAEQAARSVLKGNRTVEQGMDLIGMQAAGDVRKTIANVTTPALAPSTIANRKRRGNGSVKPLVDTRIMLPTLNHVTDKT